MLCEYSDIKTKTLLVVEGKLRFILLFGKLQSFEN